jgi:hypothetical protein
MAVGEPWKPTTITMEPVGRGAAGVGALIDYRGSPGLAFSAARVRDLAFVQAGAPTLTTIGTLSQAFVGVRHTFRLSRWCRRHGQLAALDADDGDVLINAVGTG